VVAADGAVLHGEVLDTQFYGGVSTLAVGVSGYDHPVMVTQQGATRVERGTQVGLTWDPARAVVLTG
jgi:spermidine/putrescine transport system ATP-binding protein/putrescine transport system ATP-binding protein